MVAVWSHAYVGTYGIVLLALQPPLKCSTYKDDCNDDDKVVIDNNRDCPPGGCDATVCCKVSHRVDICSMILLKLGSCMMFKH